MVTSEKTKNTPEAEKKESFSPENIFSKIMGKTPHYRDTRISLENVFSTLLGETKKILSYFGEKLGILNRSRTEQEDVLSPWYDQSMEKIQRLMEDPKEVRKFLMKINAVFQGQDIEKGITIKNQKESEKIMALFKPIFDFDESSIILSPGDIVIYDDVRGEIHIGKPDKRTHKVITSDWDIKITRRPILQENHADTHSEAGTSGTSLGARLGKFLHKNGPTNTGANSCGRAVHNLLLDFGIKNPPRGNGNQWQTLLERDSRFAEISISSLSEIPAGAILCYDGKGTLAGHPNGSKMNQKYGHVEIAGGNGKYYSYYASIHPGGSAKEPGLEQNFEKWKKATGLSGIFLPKSRT